MPSCSQEPAKSLRVLRGALLRISLSGLNPAMHGIALNDYLKRSMVDVWLMCPMYCSP